MKKWNKLLFILGSSLALVACSDSSSNASRESDSSSSEKNISSSSSSETPDAGFDTENLLPNMDLGSKFGTNLWLSAGKNGLYSLWFVDSANAGISYGTVVSHADLSDGVLAFDSTSGYVFATSHAKGDSVLAWIQSGIRLEFSMEDSTLMVKIDDAEPVAVKKATRQVESGYLAKSDSLVGKVLEWSDGDSSSIYRFYRNGEYVREVTGKSSSFEAGYYDVHRQHLLVLPVYFSGYVSILYSYTAKENGGSYELDNDISKRNYSVSSMTVDYPDKSLLSKAGWSSESNDTLRWTLAFDGEGYTIRAKTGLNENTTKIQREGAWAVFGDHLVLSVEKCAAAKKLECPAVEHGTLSKVEESSFEFENSDTSDEYAAPKIWTAIEEE